MSKVHLPILLDLLMLKFDHCTEQTETTLWVSTLRALLGLIDWTRPALPVSAEHKLALSDEQQHSIAREYYNATAMYRPPTISSKSSLVPPLDRLVESLISNLTSEKATSIPRKERFDLIKRTCQAGNIVFQQTSKAGGKDQDKTVETSKVQWKAKERLGAMAESLKQVSSNEEHSIEKTVDVSHCNT